MNACNHRAMRRPSIEFTLMALRPQRHDICVLNLPHVYDNIINRLAKNAKVLAYIIISQNGVV